MEHNPLDFTLGTLDPAAIAKRGENVKADLAFSMGVPNGAPEVEEALRKILKACLAADVACGMSINADQMAGRIKEGWRMLNLGGG